MVEVKLAADAAGKLNGHDFNIRAGEWTAVPWVVAECLRALDIQLEERGADQPDRS